MIEEQINEVRIFVKIRNRYEDNSFIVTCRCNGEASWVMKPEMNVMNCNVIKTIEDMAMVLDEVFKSKVLNAEKIWVWINGEEHVFVKSDRQNYEQYLMKTVILDLNENVEKGDS